MYETPLGRITPLVGRLLAINAVVLLLQQTLFTSPDFYRVLRFDPALAFDRPWTFGTYMFLHGGLLHLLGNSLALIVFGPPVERRLGGRLFFLYYLFCGFGAAVVSLVLFQLVPTFIDPFVGASGAILGVALAFAKFHPDVELLVFPFPAPIRARTLVIALAALDVVGAVLRLDNVAHVAHLGGMAFGWLFFATQRGQRSEEPPRMAPLRPRVTVASQGTATTSGRSTAPLRGPRPEPAPATPVTPIQQPAVDGEALEIDRVLDKISATGIASLTAEERTFLDSVARKRRGDDTLH